MPTLKNIRFQKTDQFDNSCYVVNMDKEQKQYKKLSKYYKQLNAECSESFLPIYENTKYKYATLRLKKDEKVTKLKLNTNDVVDVKFNIYKKQSEEKVFVNCYVSSIKLVKRAEPVDLGDAMTFTDSDDDDDEDED